MDKAIRRNIYVPGIGYGALVEANELRQEFKLTQLGFSQRSCLRCDKIFLSQGPQNRMCDTCRALVNGAESEYPLIG